MAPGLGTALVVFALIPAVCEEVAFRGFILSGSLCLIGLIGPFADVLGLRTIGILGYTVVFGLTCLPLSRTFNAGTGRANSGAA